MITDDAFNALFTQKLDTAEGKEKLAKYGGSYLRDRLREESFARKVVPPQPITRAECQRSTNHDTLVKIVDIEPESRAMSLTFRGQPTARVIRAPRYEIPFFTISSEKFEKTEQELLAYEMPITKIIEDNSMKDIQEIEDRTFLIHCESCVQALQNEVLASAATKFNGSTVLADPSTAKSVTKGELAQTAADQTSYNPLALQKPDLTALFKLFVADGTRLRCDRFLMTDHDFEDVLSWTIEDFGDKVQSEVAVDGYKYNVLMGRKFIRTIKSDILRDGNIYAYTSPDFFGRFYILNNTKFYIDKIANRITWQAWEDIAMGFGMVAGVRKLELYPGSVRPGAQDSASGALGRLPKSEEDLGAMNNRVDDGTFFPKVQSF